MHPAIRSIQCVVAVVAAVSALAACTSAPTHRGEVKGSDATISEWLQSDMNRVANVGMRENLNALLRLADKLYRRNPAEWKKGGYASREEAIAALKKAIELVSTIEPGNAANAESGQDGKAAAKAASERAPEKIWPPLKGKRDIEAMDLALSPEFTGDRVGSFIFGTVDMIVTAHGGKTEFYLIDGQDAQHLYNAARNVEIAVWMLAHRRGPNGKPLLLADEINAGERNLSFEREFGKIIARLDMLAEVTTEKYRRAVIGYAQGIVGGTFLQFLPVR
ncbi:hypothetical protein H9K76_23290 [Diaphorobacter ruginosibacter]|uniref:Lipoprotein n=1 Tax=Diaphorobacter ruginosibacter TaxID=1715720 RepID=A0A7G9RP07_9BURK|nr:hypothetical protein [Diaphorobacter ruginosibacter]QNN57332.1 hypothetical protein H9K76_23290 [Diaphorobacter ruginosibacter]